MSLSHLTPAGLVAIVLAGALSPAASGETCLGRPVTIQGTDDDDVLEGTPGPDVIAGGGGRDTISGRGGADRICGGSSRDSLDGQGGDDLVNGGGAPDHSTGGAGDDRLVGAGGSERGTGDVLDGGTGDDRMRGTVSGDAFFPGPGNDVVRGLGSKGGDDVVSFWDSGSGVRADLEAGTSRGEGRDRLLDVENVLGSRFDDVLKGSAEDNLIVPGRGDDGAYGRGGSDLVLDWVSSTYVVRTAGEGNDVLDGGAGADDVSAGCGEDTVRGGPGHDYLRRIGGFIDAGERIDCSYGPDSFSGGERRDLLVLQVGPAYANLLTGRGAVRGTLAPGRFVLKEVEALVGPSRSRSRLVGDGGPNRLVGGNRDDRLEGKGGRDNLIGGPGADHLDGGPGVDRLSGVEGDDTCVRGERNRSC